MATAQIKINGTAGSNDNITFSDTVNLSNNDNTGVVTYQWTLVSKPAGSTAALSNPTDDAPTFVADAEGTYLIRLVVNAEEPSEDTDQVVAAVRELQTNNRIPAAGETTENNSNSASTGWAYEAVDQILQRVTRMEDEGFITAVASGVLSAGTIVKITGSEDVGTGTNVRKLPKIALVNASIWNDTTGILGYLVGPVHGVGITAGTICRVMLHGYLPSVSISGGLPVGYPVYVSNTGTFSNAAGDNPRVVATVSKVVTYNSVYDIVFSGYQSQLPYGSAGADLDGFYPNPTVAKINGTTVTTPGGGLATNRVLMTTSTNAADWKQINLSTTSTFTGKLYPTQGGTGSTDNAIQGGVMYGYTTSEYKPTAAGTTGQFLRSNGLGAPGWYAVDLGNSTSVTGKLDFVNGGTNSNFDPGVANKGGVVYFNNTTQRYQPNTSGTTSQVLIGGDEPTWGTVPSGAFETASIPYNALQSAAAFNQVTSGIVTVDTTSWTPLINYVDWPVKQGVFVFGIVPMFATAAIPSPVMLNKVTCLANNHSAKISVRYTITGPNDNWNPDGAVGFKNVRVYEQEFNFTQSSAGHIVGSVPFSMMTEFVPGAAAGNFSFLVEARINTAGTEKWELQNYRLRLAQG